MDTGEESLLAGWKLLYGLQEQIRPPVEQRGTNEECFCTLCLKPTWELRCLPLWLLGFLYSDCPASSSDTIITKSLGHLWQSHHQPCP